MCFDAAIRGGPVTGSAAADPTDSVLIQRTVGSYKVLVRFLYLLMGTVRSVKNYAVHQSLEDPGSASQQPECNGPAPH